MYPRVDPQTQKGEITEMTYDSVITTKSLQGKIENVEVVEDFESRPQKAVTFHVERDNELQEVQ